jgi:hypothetical protein
MLEVGDKREDQSDNDVPDGIVSDVCIIVDEFESAVTGIILDEIESTVTEPKTVRGVGCRAICKAAVKITLLASFAAVAALVTVKTLTDV